MSKPFACGPRHGPLARCVVVDLRGWPGVVCGVSSAASEVARRPAALGCNVTSCAEMEYRSVMVFCFDCFDRFGFLFDSF